VKCTLSATCSGYHNRTIFSLDWGAPLLANSSDTGYGYIATASADNSICIFAVQQAALENSDGALNAPVSCQLECRKEQAHPCDVNCVRWHPKDGNLIASAGDDGCIKIWKFKASSAS
jgi:WD40 repeat protein